MRSIALLLLLAMSIPSFIDAIQVLGFSKLPCTTTPTTMSTNAKYFAMDGFSLAGFSKQVGAYNSNNHGLPELANLANVFPYHCVLELETTPSQEEVTRTDMDLLSLSNTEASQLVEWMTTTDTTETVFLMNSEAGQQQQRRRQLALAKPVFVSIGMNPELFFGLFLMIALAISLILFFCCCMDAIVTPTRFAKSGPPRGKEYF